MPAHERSPATSPKLLCGLENSRGSTRQFGRAKGEGEILGTPHFSPVCDTDLVVKRRRCFGQSYWGQGLLRRRRGSNPAATQKIRPARPTLPRGASPAEPDESFGPNSNPVSRAARNQGLPKTHPAVSPLRRRSRGRRQAPRSETETGPAKKNRGHPAAPERRGIRPAGD